MTLREKLELEIPSKEEDKEVIHLYKEGKSYAAYQYSACLMKRYIKPDIQLMRKNRKDGFSYLRVGLPIDSKVLLTKGWIFWWIMV